MFQKVAFGACRRSHRALHLAGAHVCTCVCNWGAGGGALWCMPILGLWGWGGRVPLPCPLAAGCCCPSHIPGRPMPPTSTGSSRPLAFSLPRLLPAPLPPASPPARIPIASLAAACLFLLPAAEMGDALHAAELALSLEKLNFSKLRVRRGGWGLWVRLQETSSASSR